MKTLHILITVIVLFIFGQIMGNGLGYMFVALGLLTIIVIDYKPKLKQCPKCDSTNLKTIKPGFFKQNSEAWMHLFTMGIRKPTPPLNVCRDCGFSWEDR